LHCHLRPIFSLRHQLAREQLACGLPSERANERSKRFIATISRRMRRATSRSPIAMLSRSDHNARDSFKDEPSAVRMSATVSLEAIT
jgi:hypothetical protein